MAKSISFIELLYEEYEKQIPGGKKGEHGTLTDEQKALIEAAVSGETEPEKAAAQLPALAAWPQDCRGGAIDDWIDDNHGQKEIPAALRFLRLAHAEGGSDYACKEVQELLEWEHRGITRKHLFGEGKLDPLMELSYLFCELYDDIHEYEMNKRREEIDGVYQKNPSLFTEIAAMPGNPFASLRAASYLHKKGNGEMEARISELLAGIKKLDDEFSFTLAAENDFVHPGIRERLKENFIKRPSYMSGRIGWNMYHCDKYLDRSLIIKKRNDEKEEPAKMNYILKLCRDIGVPDSTAYKGIIDDFASYHKQELADFMKGLSHAEFENAVSWLRTEPIDNGVAHALLALVTVCSRRPKEDFAVLADILAERWDDVIRQEIISGAKTDDDKKHLEDFFFHKNDSALNMVENAAFQAMGTSERAGELLGCFADEAPLRERIQRYAHFLVLPAQLHPAAYFTRSLWRTYHWESGRFASYFLDSPATANYKLVFLDELCCPDSVRDPKKSEPVYLDETAEALREGGQKFLLAHKEETRAFIEGGVDFWDFCLLTCYYYKHSKEADPLPLLAIMGAKQKLVKKRIMEAIAGYPEIRPEVEKLLDSKNKQVRVTAEAVLAQWNEMEAKGAPGGLVADNGADFDIAAYAAKNMPSSAKKLLAFTNSAAWPPVHFARTKA